MATGTLGHVNQVNRRPVDHSTSVSANRRWWDDEAVAYQAEHGEFLGGADLVYGPEGWREADLRLLGRVKGSRALEIGAGAAQGSRWLSMAGAEVVATDLSMGMLQTGRALADTPPMAQCDGARLPFADECFDLVVTAYGVIPFVADSAGVMREAARVLRPGGRFVFSTTHPIRWAFPDDPGPAGLVAQSSYFDRTPYVEQDDEGQVTYVEHHRTMGDRVREIAAAGLVLIDLIEPEWPSWNTQIWGGWSPQRGAVIPGTAIFVTIRPT
jgi:SAM-dependent methyltransferase